MQTFQNCCNSRVEPNVKTFKTDSDVIIANRMCNELNDVEEIVFTRDIFGAD